MSPLGRQITVHDMTLRDGMHPKRHQMTLDQMRAVATGLDRAGVPYRFFRHTGVVRSLEQAAMERGQQPQQVVRSLLFRLAGNPDPLSGHAVRHRHHSLFENRADVDVGSRVIPGCISSYPASS